jgi:hypothetical protein
MNASELVIQLHDLARDMKDNRIRKIADDLAEIAKWHSDKGYRESTHEKQAEFAKNRNYHYTNTDNPIDFPEGFYDVGNMSLDDIKRRGRE